MAGQLSLSDYTCTIGTLNVSLLRPKVSYVHAVLQRRYRGVRASSFVCRAYVSDSERKRIFVFESEFVSLYACVSVRKREYECVLCVCA